MLKIGIVGGGPVDDIPTLKDYKNEIDIWIGADRGGMNLLQHGIIPDVAIGDFDSLSKDEKAIIEEKVSRIISFPSEKDETDIELAIQEALSFNPDSIFLFGVTGGRLDHELINIQLLYRIASKHIKGIILNKYNWIELILPGKHMIEYDPTYRYISFIPQTQVILDLTLEGFYYPLHRAKVDFGTSISVSNQLIGKKGTFSFSEGILLLIKSHDGRQ